MEFLGFANNDFDFFRKKNTLNKTEYDQKREELKRRFREFCYQIQKCYHSTTNSTLVFDKDFQGLGKNRNSILARCKIDSIIYLGLNIVLSQDSISINLVCPPDGDCLKFQEFKNILTSRREIFTKFFNENKNMFLVLFKRNLKKIGEDMWEEEFKFENNELSYGELELLINNMEKLQPSTVDSKKSAGVNIRTQISKSDAVKTGKQLPAKVCGEIVNFLDLCKILK